MSIIFDPSGFLNISQDPSNLPETADQFNIQSGAMVRCKNLRINQKGIAKTRDGSSKFNPGDPIDARIWWMDFQNDYVYSFANTSIFEDTVEVATGLTNYQWTSFQYNAVNDIIRSIFATNGTDKKRITNSVIAEWGMTPPSSAPVNSVGAATGLTGVYNTKYTYVRKIGSTVVSESNPSSAGNATTLANQKLNVSIASSADSQVTHVRLYRTFAGGEEYFFDQDVTAGTTSFVSSQADSALGDLLEEDHDRPPSDGSFVLGPFYDGTCFMIVSNRLYFCKPKQPEYWPALYYIEVSSIHVPGQTLVFHNGQLHFLTKNEIYYIQGTGASGFLPFPMRAKTGAQGYRGALSVAGRGIYHTGVDGIYLFASGSDTKITEDSLEPLFRGEDTQGMPGVYDMASAILLAHRNSIYFFYPDADDSEGCSNVLVLNMDTNRTSFYTYADPDNLDGEMEITTAHSVGQFLYCGDEAGFIRFLENKSVTSDSGNPIEFEIQSKDFVLATRKHFPRWVKYDVDASDADSCEGELLLGGATLHTHTITGNRDTRRRLVEADNGNRAAFRISGEGQVSIYGVESE